MLQLGNVQVMGTDLSGVSFDAASGLLTIGGTADVTVQGTGQGGQAILLTGSGAVTLQQADVSTLTIASPEARIFSAGRTTLGEVRLQTGAALTLGGGGLLSVGGFRGDGTNVLRLSGGAVVLTEKNSQTLAELGIPVLVEGPASLAARASRVRDPGGRALTPMDVVWKTLLPGFSAVTSLTLDGRQTRLALSARELPDPIRLWLAKGDSSHGSPIHALTVRGRDEFGRPRTRYAYLLWNQREGSFQETAMYPNPFTVTGGEEGTDWVYEEESHTLRILSNQVTAIAGGAGTDANQTPFSGRIALADGIGEVTLTLGGVACRVSSGSAFRLGRENHVKLLLQSGSSNHFESGEGFAGISLGDGASLEIDCAKTGSTRDPAGVLTAAPPRMLMSPARAPRAAPMPAPPLPPVAVTAPPVMVTGPMGLRFPAPMPAPPPARYRGLPPGGLRESGHHRRRGHRRREAPPPVGDYPADGGGNRDPSPVPSLRPDLVPG